MKLINDHQSASMRLLRPDTRGWKRRCHRSLRAMIFMLVIIFARLPLFAQEKPLDIEQAGIQPPIQMGRPIPSWWDVKVRGSVLVEGRFEFRLINEPDRSGPRLLATVMTEDLALTGPEQQIRVLLPPVNDRNVEQLKLEIQFRGKHFNQSMGTHILRVATSKSRTLMVLKAQSRLTPKRSFREQIVRRLAFETLVDGLDEFVKTIQATLDPRDLPQEPLGYCAYEMVILFGDEFRQLKKPQLDALTAWVRAGGSLYLEPTSVLEPYHVEWLRSLTAFGPADLIIQPDSKGRLNPGTIRNDERMIQITNGLGRIVLRVDDEQPDVLTETLPWREATAFLWRWHSEQAQAACRQPSIGLSSLVQTRPLPGAEQFGPVPNGALRGQFAVPIGSVLSGSLPSSASELVDWLMPEGVRMVPLWVLGLILILFVVWIGPIDYFGLGWLKARKYTWVTFPLSTFLVTGLTVWITNSYMSSAETRRGLVVRDIGDDGAVVRANRFELLFTAATRPVTTEIRKGVFSAMSRGRPIVEESQMPQQTAMQGFSEDDGFQKLPARMSGRIPTDFTVTQDLAKWTPQLNRHFSIPGTSSENEIDWQGLMEGISVEGVLTSNILGGDLVDRVKRHFGQQAVVAILGSDGRWTYVQGSTWSVENSPNHYSDGGIDIDGMSYPPVIPPSLQHQPALFRWIYRYSTVSKFGFFSLVSQIGPTGGPQLEDLPIFDTSNPDLALLIIVAPTGDDIVVYRKLLRTGSRNVTMRE